MPGATDNVVVLDGLYSETVASDAIGGVHYQRTKVSWGIEGAAQDACHLYPLPVDLYTPARGATLAAPLTALVLDEDRTALIVTRGTGLSSVNDSILLKDSSGGEPIGANADAASATGSLSTKLRFIAATGIPITSIAAGATLIGDVDLQPRAAGPHPRAGISC